MNIKLKNADYSQNKISVVADVVTLKKTATNTAVLVVGHDFTNGQVLHYRITIDSVGSASGTCEFQFAYGSRTDATNISSFIGTKKTINIVVGNYVEGDITVAGISTGTNDIKVTINNVTTALKTIKYTLQYYIVSED